MKAPLLAAAAALLSIHSASAQQSEYASMVASHAAANGVPVELVHRVIMRESRYQPRAVSKGNYGMMQIRLGTARGLGYTGTAEGLLDPNTNLTYAVKYLAGAYKAAGGNQDQAVRYYAAGYYYAAKRQGLTQQASAVQPNIFAQQPVVANNQPNVFDAFAMEQPVRHRHTRHRRHHR
ncbi:MAG: transglycosylase SLT domain-containing protein [Afipia sp.]|nr:transglycosylase SLT domain-containing protein [Afipia sp.]